MKNEIIKRDGFTTSLGVIAATLGSAVGLGNIWKFPSLTGINGGASFLVLYLISTVLVGLPVMIAEISMGRSSKTNAIETLKKLPQDKKPWWLVGVAGVAAAFLILAFYTEVAGWVFSYIFKAVSGAVVSTDPRVMSDTFGKMVSSPVHSLLCQWGVLALISFIVIKGVSKGIENMTKRLMPVLFLLLVIVGVRSLTLPGASEGLKFLFIPDFSKITWTTLLVAMGLAFFKLSIGMGTMMTYGSYFRDDQNIPATATRVMLADLSVSMLAGIAIFPAVFALGFKPDAGPSLLFITIPAVFSSIPMGYLFVALFFILASIATMGAMVSILEVPVAFLTEQFDISRTKATLSTVLLIAVFGSMAALSGSTLKDFKLFGMNMFDLFDFISSNILMPAGGLLIAVFAGWFWGAGKVKAELTNRGALKNEAVVTAFLFIVKWVTPLLVLIILLNGLKLL